MSVTSDPAESSTGDSIADDGSAAAATIDTSPSGLLEDVIWDVVVEGTEVCVAAESMELQLRLERNCIDTSGVAAGFAGGAGTGRSDFPGVWVFVVLPGNEVVEVSQDGVTLPYGLTNGAVAVLSPTVTETEFVRVVLVGPMGTSTCEFSGLFLSCGLGLGIDESDSALLICVSNQGFSFGTALKSCDDARTLGLKLTTEILGSTGENAEFTFASICLILQGDFTVPYTKPLGFDLANALIDQGVCPGDIAMLGPADQPPETT